MNTEQNNDTCLISDDAKMVRVTHKKTGLYFEWSIETEEQKQKGLIDFEIWINNLAKFVKKG